MCPPAWAALVLPLAVWQQAGQLQALPRGVWLPWRQLSKGVKAGGLFL